MAVMTHSDAADAVVGRPVLFFWLFLIATANKMWALAVASVNDQGWANAAFNLFGISAILWLALAAGLALLRSAAPAPLRRMDHAVAALTIGAALLPIYSASGIALTLVAAYAILTGRQGSELRRAAIIFLAMTSTLMWGPLILGFFNGPILGIDAWLVSHLAGAQQAGNQLHFIGSADAFVIAPGCSSFHGMSLALVFWATVNQWFRVRFDWQSLVWVAAALAATIAINVLRIGAIARFPDHFDAIHTGWGAEVAAWTTLLLVVGICLYGARRDVFADR
jgi:exosortase/archaeosortase family protein